MNLPPWEGLSMVIESLAEKQVLKPLVWGAVIAVCCFAAAPLIEAIAKLLMVLNHA